MKATTAILVCAAVLGVAGPAQARIKLATLPLRERVEIMLDNGKYTLVEEERIVPLLKSTPLAGNNTIDFSWSNATIDKDSIQFRPIAIRRAGRFRPVGKIKRPDGTEVNEVAVINVAYPPNENALVWEVFANEGCAVKVRVSYLISNLTRWFAYRALAEKNETALTLRKYLVLRNYSGEDFGSAGVWAGFGPKFLKLIGQQEEIKILLHRFAEVPIEKTFTFDWHTHGRLNPDKPLCSKVVMHYRLTNDEKHGMGLFPMQPGKARIFIKDGRGGEVFLGEDWAKLTPLDDVIKLYLGEARDIVCQRTLQTNRRHPVQGNLRHQEVAIRYQIENFKDKACTLDIVEQLNKLARQYGGDPHGDAEWEMGERTSRQITLTYDGGRARPVLHVKLPARPKDKNKKVEKVTVLFHLTLKNLW